MKLEFSFFFLTDTIDTIQMTLKYFFCRYDFIIYIFKVNQIYELELERITFLIGYSFIRQHICGPIIYTSIYI
jgi:hypothetical protein